MDLNRFINNSGWNLAIKLEPWMDWILPLAMALLASNQKTCAYALVYCWLLIRLLLQSQGQSALIWLFIGLALLNAGTIIQQRGGQPSDPSDLLLIVLAFVAGVRRTEAEWQRSLAQISASLAPIALTAVTKPAEELLQFPGINVNRMSFLLGILTVLTWGLSQHARKPAERWSWIAASSLGIPLALATGSRAALIAPALAILIGWLIRNISGILLKTKHAGSATLKAFLALTLLITIAGGSALTWYRISQNSRIDIISDVNRFSTTACWASAPFREGKPLTGLGFNIKVRKLCDGKTLEPLRTAGLPKGLPHAHNVIAQILAETGMAGLAAVSGFVCWALWRLTHEIKLGINGSSLIQEAILPFMIYLALTGMTTSFQVFLPVNQAIIGYCLASLALKSDNSKKPLFISEALEQAD